MNKLLATLMLVASTTFANATDIRMMTENYPPYNMEVNGKLTGLSIEVLEAMLKQMESKQDIHDIELLSWDNAYSSTLEEKNSMVFATTRTKSREKLFKWVGPISKTTIGITALKMNNIKINNISDLKKYRIGTIKNDIGETILINKNILESNKGVLKNSKYSLNGTNSLVNSINDLERNKIDLFAYETKVARYSTDLNGYDSTEYEVVYILENNELYFAFNRLTPNSTITKWQQALDTIKSNGIYQKIIKKY